MLRLVYNADWVERRKPVHPAQPQEKPEVENPRADIQDAPLPPQPADTKKPIVRITLP